MDLQSTLAEAVRDKQTTDHQREQILSLPHGSSFFDSPCHRDYRGSVTELYDTRWNWHQEPLVFAYMFTIRPGMIKGWGLHKLHEDRYFVIRGEMELVMYDPRPESPTFGKVSHVYLSAAHPRLVNVPRNVWHADRTLGTEDVMVVNFPTMQYDHANPDKYRLPLDTDLIPYSFDTRQGG
jgi:dTDP-4-dehydrorhamnose 3,5-epimerase